MRVLKALLFIPVLALAACAPIPLTATPAVPAPSQAPAPATSASPTAAAIGGIGTPSAGMAMTPGTQAAPQKTLVDTHWQLVSFGPTGAEAQVLPGSVVTLDFQAGGQAGGSGGCNTFGGTYQVQGSKLTFSQIVSTLRACADNAVTEQEQRYFQALQAAGQFSVAGDRLTIWHDDQQGVLNFAAAVPATPTVPPAGGAANSQTPTAAGHEPRGGFHDSLAVIPSG